MVGRQEQLKQLVFDLWLVPGLGPVTIKKIIDRISSSDKPLSGSSPLQRLERVYAQFSIRSLEPKKVIELSEQERGLLQKYQISYTTIACEDYPFLLSQIANPPAVIFFKGDLSCLNQHCFSVVGSRKNSAYASEQTQLIIRDLAKYIPEATIVSGLAYGIDSIAHQSALHYALKTAAVLGSGLLSIYPPKNRGLAEEILRKGGCILSELPCTSKPLSAHFPLRNRIIAGLSKALLVMEAGEKSGSLITARYALDNNREVFALPGQINYPSFHGTNKLIRNARAILLTSAEDILAELGFGGYQNVLPVSTLFTPAKESASAERPSGKDISGLSADQQRIMHVLHSAEKHEEELSCELGIAFSETLKVLTMMELQGLVRRIGKGYWKQS